jgi:hypothetical protein
MPKSARKRRAETPEQRMMPTALSLPFAAWAILLAAVCLFVAYVILRPML